MWGAGLLTAPLHKHLPHWLALTLGGREERVLREGGRGLCNDVILLNAQPLRELRFGRPRPPAGWGDQSQLQEHKQEVSTAEGMPTSCPRV